MTQGPFVIVGGGLAGASAAAQLRKDGFDGPVVLIGEEAEHPYERPALSKEYLRGDGDRGALAVHPPSFYDEHGIDVRTSTPATQIDAAAREVVLGDGHRLGYDRLLIATGSSARRLDVPGADLTGVMHLRTVGDADAIRTAATSAAHVIVVGGGWIGTEVAASLRQLGRDVTMVIPGGKPLERLLGTEVGAVYRALHEAHGVRIVSHQRVTAMRGTHMVEAVETTDGSRIAADLVVLGVGAGPRQALAADAGLDVLDGIVVDEHLQTSVGGVFAAGDVAAAWHPVLGARIRVEHWDNARRQGRAAARSMLGLAEPYTRLPYLYSDQYDLSMEYVGHAPAWDRVVFRGAAADGRFLAFWMAGGRVVAGMNANVPKMSETIRGLIQAARAVDPRDLADPAIPLADLRGPASPEG